MSVRLERLLRIYNRLRRGPLTIAILSRWAKAAGIQVSERQLYRDLNELKSLRVEEGENVVVYVDEKNHKTWKLEYDGGKEKLTPFDVNAYFLLKHFAPHSVGQQREASLEKLERIFYRHLSKSNYQGTIEAGELYLRRTDFFESRGSEGEHRQIEDLLWALQNKRALTIEGFAINPANLKKVVLPLSFYPMELLFHRGRIYIAGLKAEGQQLLIFAVEQHLRFALTNTPFNRKKYLPLYKQQSGRLFGICCPVDGRVYRIKVEFTKGYAESMMHFHWHASEQWRPLKSGNYMLELHCAISRELIGFLAHGLDKIKIHQPQRLQTLLVKKMRQALDVHIEDRLIGEEQANEDY